MAYFTTSPVTRAVFCIIIFLCSKNVFAQPSISSFNPASGPVGTSVTITGSNFDAAPAKNIVYFGAVQAIVTTATNSTLSVKVPAGATFQPVTVTTGKLTAYADKPFIVTFSGIDSLNANSFVRVTDMSVNQNARNIAAGDLNGDGKADLAVTNNFSNSIAIFRNTSAPGAVSLIHQADIPAGTAADPTGIAIGDLNGDGKLDLVVTTPSTGKVLVYKNESASNGNIGLYGPLEFSAGLNPVSVAIDDIDGDGKSDLVVANSGSNTVSLLRNTTLTGDTYPVFGEKTNYATGATPSFVCTGDLNGDHKPEIVVINYDSKSVSIFKNISTAGNPAFEQKLDFAIGNHPTSVSVGDLDGDGKPDLATGNFSFGKSISLLKNTSAGGNVSFDPSFDFTYKELYHLALGDVDGDGRLDITVPNFYAASLSVFKNRGSTAFDANAFAEVQYNSRSTPRFVAIVDLDTDGKPDLVSANLTSTISVFRNRMNEPLIGSVEPNTAGSGTTVKIKGNNFTGATAVSFGGVPAASFTLESPSVISAVIGAGASGNVTVTTPQGTAAAAGFTYVPAPVITSFSPKSVDKAVSQGGVLITVTGRNLTYTTGVSFGGTPSPGFSVYSDTSVLATLGLGSSGSVTVSTLGGTATLPGFIYIPPPAPVVSSFTPVVGASGAKVTIKGKNFIDVVAVSAGGKPVASYKVDSVTSISAVIGTGSSGDITVTTMGGTAKRPGFVYNPPALPRIDSYAPVAGAYGTTVTIKGTNFLGTSMVNFGNTAAASYKILDNSTIQAVVGDGSAGRISLKTPADTASAGGFRFIYPDLYPEITSFTPHSAGIGSTVTIHGKNLSSTQLVAFGDYVALSHSVLNDSTVIATVGTGASGTVRVITRTDGIDYPGFVFMGPPPVPVITSITPIIGPAGSRVTIKGANFGDTSTSNTVFFGAVKAQVMAASDTSLSVIVPPGTTYQPVSVTANSLQVSSGKPYVVTFPGTGAAFASNSLKTGLDYKTGLYDEYLLTGDLDGDGLPDNVITFIDSLKFSVFRNTSSPGLISYGPKTNYVLEEASVNAQLADLDCDGKLDLLMITPNSVSIYRNTSIFGNISFGRRIVIPLNFTGESRAIMAGDLDNDGKPEIVLASHSQITILKNLSRVDHMIFGAETGYAVPYGAIMVSLSDLDKDGKLDVVTADPGNNLRVPASFTVFKNAGTGTGFTHDFFVRTDYNLGIGTNVQSLNTSDLNRDGKPEIIMTINNLRGYVAIFKNTTAGGVVSFVSQPDYNTDDAPFQTAAGDLDGDGKVDLAVVNFSYGTISLFKHTGSADSISFAPQVVYKTGLESQLVDVRMGDIDGDGKPDLSMINYGTGEFTVARNTVGEPKIVPSGSNPLVSETVSRFTVDSSVQTYNGHPYVQRHYDIEPVGDASKATARVTLYFFQEEFNHFNAFPGHGLNLPAGPEDNAGKAALRIYQYHGFSATGLPGSYTGPGEEINPDDADIVWNATAQWWEVSFEVNGLSGFFAGSASGTLLPLKLVSFSALPQEKTALLQWVTTQEDNLSFFELQRSTGTGDFSTIGTLSATGNFLLNHTYSYTDTMGIEPIYYYRLKMVERDGSFTYSKTVSVIPAVFTGRLTIYPNPAKDYATVKHPSTNHVVQLSIIDINGRAVKTMNLDKNTSQSVLSLKDMSNGNYKIIWRDGTKTYIQTLIIFNH